VNKLRRTIAVVPVPPYQQFWADKQANLKKEFETNTKTHPDAVPCIQQLFKMLCDLEDLARITPVSVGKSEEWAAVIGAAEDNRESYSVALQGKTLYSALYGTYTVTFNELKSHLKPSTQSRQPSQGDGFQEVRSRKRHSNAKAPVLRRKQLCQLQQGRCQLKTSSPPSGQPKWTLIPQPRNPAQKRHQLQGIRPGRPQ
jgi:hypothetical protein